MAVQRTNSKIPRSGENDYTPEAAAGRREFLRERTGAAFDHVSEFSFDPALAQGNIENFIGVAQVPLGVAGSLLVNGEHAQGEFYVPLATAEGTLVASYNRGMRLLSEAGGVTTTVIADKMQRAPAFIFESAREARDFAHWLDEHFDEIMHADTELPWRARLVSNLGGFRAPTTTAPTRPTGSPRSSSRPGRTWPTWPSHRPPTTTVSCSRTAISTSP